MSIRSFFYPTISLLQKIEGGAIFGTQYDLSDACSKCGAGAMAIGPRILEGIPESTEPLVRTYEDEVLIEDALAQKLKAIGVSSFAEVINEHGDILPYQELRPEAVLPPFSSSTTGYEIECQCGECKRNGHFHLNESPLRLVYQSLPGSYTDMHVLATHEIFALTRREEKLVDCGFHNPLLIFSDAIVRELQKAKLDYISFEPVTIDAVV